MHFYETSFNSEIAITRLSQITSKYHLFDNFGRVI